MPNRRLAALLAAASLLAGPCLGAGIGPPVAIGAATSASGSLTLALTTNTVCGIGSEISVLAGNVSNNGTTSVADPALTPYIANSQTILTGSVARQRFFFTRPRASVGLASGNVQTITYPATTGAKLAVAACTPGVLSTGIDADPAGTTGTSTAPSITSPSLAYPAALVLCGYLIVAGGGDTFTPTAGFTALTPALSTDALRWEYKIVSAVTAVTCAPTLGTSRTWGASLVSYSQTEGLRAMGGVGQ